MDKKNERPGNFIFAKAKDASDEMASMPAVPATPTTTVLSIYWKVMSNAVETFRMRSGSVGYQRV